MEINKIKFIGDGDEDFRDTVHFSGGSSTDYTLCGLTLDGDLETCGSFNNTKEKVNCKNCIDIVEYCKSIRKTNYM